MHKGRPMKSADFQTIPFPASRQIVVDGGHLAAGRHIVHGLLEVDVTTARQFIRDHKDRSGETLSFAAYVINCLAAAVKTHPPVCAYRGWRGPLIVFDDVDVATLIEIEQDTVAVPHIIRAANRKSLTEVHQEIRAIQSRSSRSPQELSGRHWIFRLPRFLRLLLMRLALKNPHFIKHNAGTVVLTSVGMFGRGYGWGIGFLPMHTLGITLGGIAEKPAWVEDQPVSREYLCMTISFDHDIVDGAPAARFARCFKELLESGFGLEASG